MLSVGAGSKVKVQEPSPLSEATGPAAGSQPHHGPVNATDVALEQTVVVIVRTLEYKHEPSSTVAAVS